VSSEAPGEIAGLNVTLASSETFAQYGLSRPASLNDLRFSVVEGDRGGVIRVTSTQAMVEPFVTLLLEVRWPQGRLLREFTVLLDPPDFATAAVRQPVQRPVEQPATPAAAPAAVARPPEAAREVAPAPPGAEADGGERSHTVARRETLWGIAERYRPDASTDINRMMVSIYRANPEAFAGNINRLRAGAVLRIPDRAAVDSLDTAEAGVEVQRQNREWQGTRAAPAPAEPAARLELVPPPETAPPAPAPTPTQAAEQAPAAKLQSELEESRRLLAVKDAELKALRDRITALERGAGDVEIEAEPAPEAPPAAAPPAPEAPVAEEPAKPAPAPPAKPARPPAAQDSGILGAIGDLLTSVWLWVAAAVVLIGALLIARRRSAAAEPESWQVPPSRVGREGVDAEASAGSTMIVHEEPARASGRFERRALARGEEELPLERTISTEGPVNLDQADPLAEADFHMAYGLYDQAADLLTAALGREPARRDLRLKLLDVYFVWENREGFLKEARAFRDRVGNESDPDWKRVVIMGKQLCPTESLFAGGAAQGAAEMDLALTGDSGSAVDLDLGMETGALDFDLGEESGAGLDADASTKVARPSWMGSTAQTQELPTIEVPGVDGAGTRETPTIENPALSSTLETPTIETRTGDRTLETPTLETRLPDAGTSTTARLRIPGGSEDRADQTAEIDLEDLGLDLTGLDDAARDMATGLQEALPPEAAGVDFDLSASGAASEGEESTAEMEKAPSLSHITNAMGKSEAGARTPVAAVDDTVEQPGAGDSLITPALSATSDELESLNIDLDLSSAEPSQSDLTATGLRTIGTRGPEDPTMTEVGTKLDLARAYLDMGDPDGARSILNEVIEEGDPAQRQEARQLLDSLDS
jgi:pilus assembly protein FimV